MGLATAGLSMMAKGGQYTEKPQTLGGIAGEAGLAGLGTYLTLKEREESRATKEKALAATQAYQAAKLGQGTANLDLQKRRVETGERAEARQGKYADYRMEDVYDPQTGQIERKLVPKEMSTLRAPTESGTMAHLATTDRNIGTAWLAAKLNVPPSTIRVDDLKDPNTGKHVAKVFDQRTGKQLMEIPFTKFNEAVQARKQATQNADKEEKTILGKQAEAIKDLTETFRAKKGITANIMSMVGLPPDQMRAAMATAGINQKDVDAFAADLEKIRGKFLKPLHEWNQKTKDVTGGRGEIYSTLYKEYQDRKPKLESETPSIFDNPEVWKK